LQIIKNTLKEISYDRRFTQENGIYAREVWI
jgi:hypothetical protein